ncbi:HET-domain-containing protein [Dendrothele bispora CBS 962.96]|uniref:HET-domain-containing protein n=1 Tax=Dendrothele bispora (strain CBS 962.96) TaxID=1314807 RepID=A0A4S8KWZ1_DENBC|nr:HET-domain-containing protein [Dendrothele bispora CBS 962.96]
MHLLNTSTYRLETFPDVKKWPSFAILSHTWYPEQEILFKHVQGQEWTTQYKAMKGYFKLMRACEQAKTHGLKYVWVDTCCIDKDSRSAELSEAINSMYPYYRDSAGCYAYLSDVLSSSEQDPQAKNSKFRSSKWFTRGWTLQELIAPSKVIFFSDTWTPIGTKSELHTVISEVTQIPTALLRIHYPKAQPFKLSNYSIAQKMSWAAKQETTRSEDIAYCLMRIFDVNMPLLYGEGEHRAFLRLQEEIIKGSTDQSIFAWRAQKGSGASLHISEKNTPSPSLLLSFKEDLPNFFVMEVKTQICCKKLIIVIGVNTSGGTENLWFDLIVDAGEKSLKEVFTSFEDGGQQSDETIAMDCDQVTKKLIQSEDITLAINSTGDYNLLEDSRYLVRITSDPREKGRAESEPPHAIQHKFSVVISLSDFPFLAEAFSKRHQKEGMEALKWNVNGSASPINLSVSEDTDGIVLLYDSEHHAAVLVLVAGIKNSEPWLVAIDKSVLGQKNIEDIYPQIIEETKDIEQGSHFQAELPTSSGSWQLSLHFEGGLRGGHEEFPAQIHTYWIYMTLQFLTASVNDVNEPNQHMISSFMNYTSGNTFVNSYISNVTGSFTGDRLNLWPRINTKEMVYGPEEEMGYLIRISQEEEE